MKNALSVEGEAVNIDPGKMEISHGTLSNPQEVNFTHQQGKIIITWDPGVPGEDLESDQAMILAYDPDKKLVYGTVYGPQRSAGEYTITLPLFRGGCIAPLYWFYRG